MIYNFGSINADYFYRVPHLPAPGETLAASEFSIGLGGKGANQSVAIARAGAQACHIGAVGPDGDWMVDRLAKFGVDTKHIARLSTPSGHAIINIDALGENSIVIYPGANRALELAHVESALTNAQPNDWLMLQNETSLQVEAAKMVRSAGMQVAYSAAPFDPDAIGAVLPYISILFLNQVEARQLSQALSQPIKDIPVPHIFVTRGAQGADWINHNSGKTVSIPAFSCSPVDTTGAGDTFAGYLIAGLAQGLEIKQAALQASAAAALMIQQKGTAEAIPNLDQVLQFLT